MKRLVERLLELVLNPDWSDDILGDLEELYLRNQDRSVLYANFSYLWQAIRLLRPSLIRKLNLIPNNNTDMFRNYLLTGARSLMRNKLSSAINIAGLSIGLALFLLLTEYVRFETSYDTHLDEDLYRVTTTILLNGSPEVKDAMASYSVGKELFEALPEVQNFTVTKKFDPGMAFRVGDRTTQENNVISADSNFLSLFPYKVLAGDPDTFLDNPDRLILTKSKAEQYFDTPVNALGKTIFIPETFDRPFIVSGVIEDIPDNTHYKFDVIISDPSIRDFDDYQNWNYNNYYVYVMLEAGTDTENLASKVDKVYLNLLDDNKERWELGRVTDIHLRSDFTFEPEAPGSETAVNLMRFIAFFILIIAWINYINLSTAKAMDRAKEVGLRKVAGAYKGQLMAQFITETFLINLIAALLALLFVTLAIPFFNLLVGGTVITNIWQFQGLFGNFLLYFIIGTLVSGFYPAVLLSRYKPNDVLKGKFIHSSRGIVLRKILVMVQFTASIILVSGTLIIQKQVKYMMDKDLGINTDQVISFRHPNVYDEETAHRSDLFKEKLLAHNAVISVGQTSNVPGGDAADINSTTTTIKMEGKPEPFSGTTYMMVIDDGLLPTLDMSLLNGRNFDRNRPSDSLSVMVNNAFLSNFGGVNASEAVGKTLQFGSDEIKYTIIGVVNDFNRTSLKKAVEPTIYLPFLYLDYFVVKFSPQQMEDGLLHLERTWDEFYTDMPLDYSFLDSRFASLYAEDQRYGSIFLYFTFIAIFISLMGLFGLASYMAGQRTKEVGVRKVLGASVFQVMIMFVGDFLKMLMLAAIIGLPLVFYFMDSWLQNYAFRISFPWLLTLIGVILVVIFATITIALQVIKVARLQPADTLKYE